MRPETAPDEHQPVNVTFVVTTTPTETEIEPEGYQEEAIVATPEGVPFGPATFAGVPGRTSDEWRYSIYACPADVDGRTGNDTPYTREDAWYALLERDPGAVAVRRRLGAMEIWHPSSPTTGEWREHSSRPIPANW